MKEGEEPDLDSQATQEEHMDLGIQVALEGDPGMTRNDDSTSQDDPRDAKRPKTSMPLGPDNIIDSTAMVTGEETTDSEQPIPGQQPGEKETL